MKIAKRTLEELLARYELHPDICDLYVEGESDRDFFRWFLESNERLRAVVYPITEVHIPSGLPVGRGLQDNNRDRVIFLAIYLEESLGPLLRVTCIADSDFDHFLGIERKHALLLMTDYTSLEMYAFKEGAVHKVARLLGYKTSRGGKEILHDLAPFLRLLFLYRITSHLLAFNLHWLDVCRCCKIKSDAVEFDEPEFRKRYFNTRGLDASNKAIFVEKLEEFRTVRSVADDRFCIRGRDFTESLAWYLAKSIARTPHPDSKTIVRMLLASVSLEELSTHSLFDRLLKKTSECT